MLLQSLNITMALILVIILISITFFLSSRSILDREKSSPFECGFDPKNKARLPFSMRFFLLAVIFLVFDIEIALLLPLPLALKSKTLAWPMMSSISFLLILIMGLFHEWNEGSLDWSP